MTFWRNKLAQQLHSGGVAGAASLVWKSVRGRVRAARLKAIQHWDVDIRLRRQFERRGDHGGHQRDLRQVVSRTLTFIAANQQPGQGPGAYSYKPGGPALCYASCYAALTLHLCGELARLAPPARKDWAGFIRSCQGEDGLFRDPRIDIPLAAEVDWWGWRHLTLHALMALTALGEVVDRPFSLILPFQRKGAMSAWLETRNWKQDPACVSNEVQNRGTFLQYARDFQGARWCGDALAEMYRWLGARQDPATGLWGERFDTPHRLSIGVQTGYHLWLLYFYDQEPVRYPERIIDSCLRTQNRLGGFGAALNSSACEDIDSIDPLARLSLALDYRREQVRESLERAWRWVLFNQNPDGGWVFQRRQTFQYGHALMRTEKEESAMFPSWFRTLALAFLSRALSRHPASGVPWQFLDAPGHQFWGEQPLKTEGGRRPGRGRRGDWSV